MGGTIIFSTNGTRTTEYPRAEEWSFELPLIIPPKINSKLIIDLNLRVKTIKLLQENIGVNLYDLGLGSNFLDMALKAQVTKHGK